MGNFQESLTEQHCEFISRQHLFFVATAPSSDGRVNLSPKGYDTIRIVSNKRLVYLDFAGSGNETANHLAANGRITLMWNSFDNDPLILRVYGKGNVIGPAHDEFHTLLSACFPNIVQAKVRQLFDIEIELVQTSCGYGVPIMHYEQDRPKMDEWSDSQIKAGKLERYIANNSLPLEDKVRRSHNK